MSPACPALGKCKLMKSDGRVGPTGSQGAGGTARGQLRSLVCLWDSVLGLCDTVSPSVPQRPSGGRGHPVPLCPHHLLGSLSDWHVPAPGASTALATRCQETPPAV